MILSHVLFNLMNSFIIKYEFIFLKYGFKTTMMCNLFSLSTECILVSVTKKIYIK